MKKQNGFTLIELMIVVAVIGVLSAIAVPQYQKYVAKAEVATALASISSYKTNVEAFAVEKGTFPDQDEPGFADVTAASGSIVFEPDTGDTTGSGGKIVFTFGDNDTKVASTLKSKTLNLVRTTDGAWTCESEVETDLLPKNCESTSSSGTGDNSTGDNSTGDNSTGDNSTGDNGNNG